jgi:hypothetical protein
MPYGSGDRLLPDLLDVVGAEALDDVQTLQHTADPA